MIPPIIQPLIGPVIESIENTPFTNIESIFNILIK